MNLHQNEYPTSKSLPLMPECIPPNQLIHRGLFSNDGLTYYFTLSDKQFSQFDIKVSVYQNGRWSPAVNAPFNSTYNDHGMSFSPDGQTIYFSSTRPVPDHPLPMTWHLWKSSYQNGKWSKATYVDIPNLRSQLCSHPSISRDGTLYFHASQVDYSEMDLYSAELQNGSYGPAQKLVLPQSESLGRCTPYIDPDGQFLLFANLGQQLMLAIARKNEQGDWQSPTLLPDRINTNGQGNPYLSIDKKYLFFACGDMITKDWVLKWVGTEDFLSN